VSRPAGPAGVEAALTAHVGRSRQAESTLGPWPAAALAAALGRDDPPGAGEALPPFWHQLYANAAVAASATGPDGHERRGEFLPPVPSGWLRMWAGGRLRLERPLRIGERISKISTVRAVTPKRGRQGRLVFVLVEHRWEASGGEVVLVEEQDLVYREPVQPAGSVTEIAADESSWRQDWRHDPVLLFRYSALTYNGHRIHYDADYARQAEGYPGLVVHGPLLATLMLDLVRRERPDAVVRAFRFLAVAPLFAGEELAVRGGSGEGRRVSLWAAGPGRRLAMEGEAELA
jgi:3-methylfumaryl-CoA hydratase